ncbi:probable low affinity copper uptake protein 2 [Trichosurus vulpecula]|uniref:probable low affinity copper uptake protein 2 n=1 Tax=Trichosurus vulpecula TaxID=9337 RepID=UPI00186B06DB|nr:probable low affinity copper uptake protein 2 [Trichosurus vulpecula]
MHMHFIFSNEVELLFDFWKVHSSAGMAVSVLVVLLLAVLYEGIKVGKVKLFHWSLLSQPPNHSQPLTEYTDQESTSSGSAQANNDRTRMFLSHLGQSLIHVAQVVIGYFVMLAVMSYNTWIFLGVILGSAIGYYLAYPFLSVG